MQVSEILSSSQVGLAPNRDHSYGSLVFVKVSLCACGIVFTGASVFLVLRFAKVEIRYIPPARWIDRVAAGSAGVSALSMVILGYVHYRLSQQDFNGSQPRTPKKQIIREVSTPPHRRGQKDRRSNLKEENPPQLNLESSSEGASGALSETSPPQPETPAQGGQETFEGEGGGPPRTGGVPSPIMDSNIALPGVLQLPGGVSQNLSSAPSLAVAGILKVAALSDITTIKIVAVNALRSVPAGLIPIDPTPFPLIATNNFSRMSSEKHPLLQDRPPSPSVMEEGLVPLHRTATTFPPLVDSAIKPLSAVASSQVSSPANGSTISIIPFIATLIPSSLPNTHPRNNSISFNVSQVFLPVPWGNASTRYRLPLSPRIPPSSGESSSPQPKAIASSTLIPSSTPSSRPFEQIISPRLPNGVLPPSTPFSFSATLNPSSFTIQIPRQIGAQITALPPLRGSLPRVGSESEDYGSSPRGGARKQAFIAPLMTNTSTNALRIASATGNPSNGPQGARFDSPFVSPLPQTQQQPILTPSGVPIPPLNFSTLHSMNSEQTPRSSTRTYGVIPTPQMPPSSSRAPSVAPSPRSELNRSFYSPQFSTTQTLSPIQSTYLPSGSFDWSSSVFSPSSQYGASFSGGIGVSSFTGGSDLLSLSDVASPELFGWPNMGSQGYGPWTEWNASPLSSGSSWGAINPLSFFGSYSLIR